MAAGGTGLPKNTAAALSYVLGPISGVAFLLLEKDPFVRFHAMQSIVVSIAALVVNTLLVATLILAFFVPLLNIAEFVLWLWLIYQAWQGKEWEVPFLGKIARQLLTKI